MFVFKITRNNVIVSHYIMCVVLILNCVKIMRSTRKYLGVKRDFVESRSMYVNIFIRSFNVGLL